ncbi:aldehyde dehydrogenase [Paenibacillus sp. 1P03SA]|uniref:aldehyde dehydrogenase n=1 Tax=Paenibacillus sp. 1P03SA TaxID=3132294 RepID=UPI0039A0D05A
MNRIHALLDKQRNFYATGATKPLNFRMEQLRRLKAMIRDHEEAIMEALRQDLGKSDFEAFATEIGILLEEINHVLKHLKRWSKPRRVKTPLTHIGSQSRIYAEPYGIALLISPWNYPFQLAISPLIGAMSAGNCAVLKPSELAPHTSALLARLLGQTFGEEYVAVIEGGVETSNALLAEKFDTIFFTGSVGVGRIVMEAAAKHLTPVTLELGGKSPCIVHADANIRHAAKRIVWGKTLNAGQTCIAPDYLYVHESVKDELLERMKEVVDAFYGDPLADGSPYPKIINARHYNRLKSLMEAGQLVSGGRTDDRSLKIEPAFIDGVGWEDPVMQEEIFGPLLPVLTYRNLEDVIREVNARPKPLALYAFSESEEIQQRIIHSTSFGGGCINDTILHIATPYLPFGGVGNSGMGGYHGKASFDVFTHRKSVLKQTSRFDLPFRYPNAKNALKRLRSVYK